MNKHWPHEHEREQGLGRHAHCQENEECPEVRLCTAAAPDTNFELAWIPTPSSDVPMAQLYAPQNGTLYCDYSVPTAKSEGVRRHGQWHHYIFAHTRGISRARRVLYRLYTACMTVFPVTVLPGICISGTVSLVPVYCLYRYRMTVFPVTV